jgi:hypothetical protein
MVTAQCWQTHIKLMEASDLFFKKAANFEAR